MVFRAAPPGFRRGIRIATPACALPLAMTEWVMSSRLRWRHKRKPMLRTPPPPSLRGAARTLAWQSVLFSFAIRSDVNAGLMPRKDRFSGLSGLGTANKQSGHSGWSKSPWDALRKCPVGIVGRRAQSPPPSSALPRAIYPAP